MNVIPRYCEYCMNILELPNISTGMMKCLQCENTQPLPENDKKITISYYYNTGSRIITDDEVIRVLHEPTTVRKEKTCPNCSNPIMAIIRNKEYQYILACPECEYIFRS